MMRRARQLKDHAVEADLFRRRALVGFLLVLLALGGLAAWYFRLQVVQHAEFATRSEANRLRLVPVAPARGRKGRKLNAKRRAGSQAAELASIAISDEAGPEPRPGRAGAPRRPETGRGSGLGAADHGKRLYGPSRAEFRLSHARSRAGPGPSRSIPL